MIGNIVKIIVLQIRIYYYISSMAKTLKTTTALTLLERIIIPCILKKEADYKTLIINKDLSQKVSLTQIELKKFEVKVSEGGGLQWNAKGVDALFDIDFTDMEKLELKLALTKLDEDKKLTPEFISLYEKFVN